LAKEKILLQPTACLFQFCSETCNLVVSPASQMRSQDSRCQLKSTKEYSPKNKCIDRPNGKLHDWGSFPQRTAVAIQVYLLTVVPVHAVPSIFCQEIFLINEGVE